MRPEKLMIGDWVSLFQGNPDGSSCNVRVSYIGEYGEVGIEGCKEYTSANCNLLFPIPLTPEILEKNGFKKELSEDNHYWFILIHNGIRFSLFYARSVFQWLVPLDFKYVHKLQHALKLCGIDKEIEI